MVDLRITAFSLVALCLLDLPLHVATKPQDGSFDTSELDWNESDGRMRDRGISRHREYYDDSGVISRFRSQKKDNRNKLRMTDGALGSLSTGINLFLKTFIAENMAPYVEPSEAEVVQDFISRDGINIAMKMIMGIAGQLVKSLASGEGPARRNGGSKPGYG